VKVALFDLKKPFSHTYNIFFFFSVIMIADNYTMNKLSLFILNSCNPVCPAS
jgi:hypothetical protein